MPLIMDGSRNPTPWAPEIGSQLARVGYSHEMRPDCIRIALMNNMPDAALEDTESQFFDLLEAAAGEIPVHIKLFSLPEIPRDDRGKQHMNDSYSGMEDLWNGKFDAVIITGTEPRLPSLRSEPYWHTLTSVIDWAAENSFSTVLSCLAAHAGVLYSDGIERHALADKQFGVFDYEKTDDHPLTRDTKDRLRIPHSRWNEVKRDALISCGYAVLMNSAQAGADLFLKKRKRSLFVHFQGHPEYSALTLLKEYRRDIKRFIRGERKNFPTMPQGYFDAASIELLNDFQEKALSSPCEMVLKEFPEAVTAHELQNTWRPSAAAIYHNWLQYVAAKKTGVSSIVGKPQISHG
jgi:homoserine O-succinyltransferase